MAEIKTTWGTHANYSKQYVEYRDHLTAVEALEIRIETQGQSMDAMWAEEARLKARIATLEGALESIQKSLTKMAGHRLMQVANPARELLNQIRILTTTTTTTTTKKASVWTVTETGAVVPTPTEEP